MASCQLTVLFYLFSPVLEEKLIIINYETKCEITLNMPLKTIDIFICYFTMTSIN